MADLLDDPARLAAGDPQDMLRAVASGAAQVREAAALAAEAGVRRLVDEDRPRSVVVCGMGGSAIAGDIFAAAGGAACPVPVLSHRGYGLPVWVGAADLVVAVSCSGHTEETLSALAEAVRRRCRLLVVGGQGSPLEDLGRRGGGVFVPVTQGRQPRASVWALAVPLLVAGDALGLLQAPPESLDLVAVRLETVAAQCRPDADSVTNPAKTLASALTGTLPVVWGSSPLAAAAAYRFACQLNENAHYPAVHGALPEAAHNQIVSFDGPYGGGSPGRGGTPAGSSDVDLFRDRADDDDDDPASTPLHLVLLRDGDEHPQTALRARVCVELARQRGIEVSQLLAEGGSPVERIASLVGLTDWASVYLALLEGTDPTPVDAITALKQRISA